jgi:hypothetical protein
MPGEMGVGFKKSLLIISEYGDVKDKAFDVFRLER